MPWIKKYFKNKVSIKVLKIVLKILKNTTQNKEKFQTSIFNILLLWYKKNIKNIIYKIIYKIYI